MSCKKIKVGPWVCGVAIGAAALSPFAVQAQDATSTTTTTTTTTETTTMDQAPTPVTGTVLRYYTDRAGFVTAMDIQTATGVQFVRFSRAMGQRLFTTYPVGTADASVYVVGSPMMGNAGMTRYDVVSVGTTMPSPSAMMRPSMVSDIEMLDAEPYIVAGSQEMTVSGKLTDVIVNDRGEVLALVLDGPAGSSSMMGGRSMQSSTTSRRTRRKMVNGRLMMVGADGTMTNVNMRGGRARVELADGTRVELMKDANGAYMVPESMTGSRMMMVLEDGRQLEVDTVDGRLVARMADGTTMPISGRGTARAAAAEEMTETTETTTTTTMPTAMPAMGQMTAQGTLVRVPRELRHIAPGTAGSERVTPLFKGSHVRVTGYMEAPQFGALSVFENRIAANALVVNSRAVGAIGIPRMTPSKRVLLTNVNVGGAGDTSSEMQAASMGYSVYGSTTSSTDQPMMTAPDGTNR